MGAKPVSYTKWDSDITGRELPPPSLPGYKILGEIGRGSMGVIYEATSDKVGSVAIKVLNILAANGDMAVERFRREVTVGARIGHPGIPTVYDSGTVQDGRYFLVMELLRGCDLEDWWEEPGHTRAEALDLICEALEPLAAAHEHGVVHRDLKPENLFVEQSGAVRLLDFGVARDPDASQNLRTATGISVGTPVYMSPEQATKPTEVDTPADIWSVGIMLYEALCGELPFDGESPHAVILHACTREPTPLLERVPEVHEEIRELVNQCLKKDALERPADAGELHSALSALLQREEIRATLAGPAAAPSFRLSHSTAPTKIKQDLPAPVPLTSARTFPAPVNPAPVNPAPALDSTGELPSLAPASPAQGSRKFALFALAGLAAAVVVGVSMARMDASEGVADLPASTEELAPESTTFAAPPEPDPDPDPESLIRPTVPLDFAPDPQEVVEVEEDVEPSAPVRTPVVAERPQPRRTAPVRPLIEPVLDEEDAEEAPEPTPQPTPQPVVTREATPDPALTPQSMEPVAVEPPPAMVAQPTPPAVTMRPRTRPTMRTQPTEMRPERPGFVTF